MKKKIHILINTLNIGGAEKQSILLARALCEKYNTLLVVFDKKSNCDIKYLSLVQEYNLKVTYLYPNKIISTIFYSKVIISQKPEIIFSYLAFTNMVNAVLGKIFRIKFRVGGIRNLQTSKSKFLLQKFLHNYLLTTSISNSFSARKSYLSHGYRKPIFVIQNCYSLVEIPFQRVFKEEIKILSVGRFVAQKDYKTLLNAFQILLNKVKIIDSTLVLKLIIIGHGEFKDRIINQIETLGISKSVQLIINPHDLFEYYKNCDIYVSTSIFEGLSNSIMEAMANSLPVIATDVGDTKELVVDGQNGYLVQPGAQIYIAEKLLKLCKNHYLRTQMGKQSYKLIKEKFSFEIFKEKYIRFIEYELKT